MKIIIVTTIICELGWVTSLSDAFPFIDFPLAWVIASRLSSPRRPNAYKVDMTSNNRKAPPRKQSKTDIKISFLQLSTSLLHTLAARVPSITDLAEKQRRLASISADWLVCVSYRSQKPPRVFLHASCCTCRDYFAGVRTQCSFDESTC